MTGIERCEGIHQKVSPRTLINRMFSGSVTNWRLSHQTLSLLISMIDSRYLAPELEKSILKSNPFE